MPFDPTVAIVFGTMLTAFLFSLIYAFWYQQFKHRVKQGGGAKTDQSIGVGELEGLIRRAVEEATRPLNDRLDALESELDAATQPDVHPEPEPLLDLDDEAPDEYRMPERPRRRVR